MRGNSFTVVIVSALLVNLSKGAFSIIVPQKIAVYNLLCAMLCNAVRGDQTGFVV